MSMMLSVYLIVALTMVALADIGRAMYRQDPKRVARSIDERRILSQAVQ
ncbi:hypothetical protein ABFA25_01635 [Mycobacterium lepromatosis]|nr:hypothetical protein [Mycobacterium lepromatosis]